MHTQLERSEASASGRELRMLAGTCCKAQAVGAAQQPHSPQATTALRGTSVLSLLSTELEKEIGFCLHSLRHHGQHTAPPAYQGRHPSNLQVREH